VAHVKNECKGKRVLFAANIAISPIALPAESVYNPCMAHVKERSGNLIHWLKAHLPDGLYKQLTWHPDRPLRPKNPRISIAFSLFLIVLAAISLIISFLPQ
jgi:hypothetical protein